MVATLPSTTLLPSATRVLHLACLRAEELIDRGLIARFIAGEEAAFAEIVARHRTKMIQVAFRMLRDHADAEEIAQDTFIRAHRALTTFRGETSLAAWLYRIARNLSINRYWYFARRHRQTTYSFDSALAEDASRTMGDLFASESADPVRVLTNREFSDQVTACMDGLNRAQREILTQRNLQGRSYREIALMLGISLGTVKSRLTRARRSLRVRLGETYGQADPDDTTGSTWFETHRPAGRLLPVAGR